MVKKMAAILLIVVLVMGVGVMVLSAKERVLPIDQTLTGTYRAIDPSHGLFDVYLQGSPGPATGQGLAFNGPPVEKSDLPAGNMCADIPGPDGVHLVAPTGANLIYSDGSMLFSVGVEGSYLCFVPGFALAKYEISGGSGRFAEATGYWDAKIDTHSIGGEDVVGESGTVTGEIRLP